MDCVPVGTVSHGSAGERSSPSQVYSTGMLLPLLKVSGDIEICFIVVSSFVWVYCSGWLDIHPENNTNSAMIKKILNSQLLQVSIKGVSLDMTFGGVSRVKDVFGYNFKFVGNTTE